MISVIIPVYKKTEMFLKNLKNNIQFFSGLDIIVINDDPELSIRKLLKSFHDIRLYENKKNLGFGETVNKGVSLAKNKFVFLINSDVVLKDNSFKKVTDYFKKNKDLFAVGFAQTESKNEIVGKNSFFWKSGFFRHKSNEKISLGHTAWAEGGSSIFSKEKFLKLGGFDNLYSPFYWEDIDLSYRAWKMGYKVLFDPTILVKHFHESTISTYFSKKLIKMVSYRNQFIFIWKNITQARYLISHLLLLPFNLIFFILKGEIEILSGFINALFKISDILTKRISQKKFYRLSDYEVLSKINEK
jgi:GT2 family glycosyltransferase